MPAFRNCLIPKSKIRKSVDREKAKPRKSGSTWGHWAWACLLWEASRQIVVVSVRICLLLELPEIMAMRAVASLQKLIFHWSAGQEIQNYTGVNKTPQVWPLSSFLLWWGRTGGCPESPCPWESPASFIQQKELLFSSSKLWGKGESP